MDKESLIKKLSLKNQDLILEYLEINFHLSYSSYKEILDFLEEIESIKEIEAFVFLESLTFDYLKSKKENSKKLLEYIREYRNPLMYTSLKNLKESLKSFQENSFKVNYPKDLEGDTLTINITLKNEKDIDTILVKLEKEKENLKKAIRIIKKGG